LSVIHQLPSQPPRTIPGVSPRLRGRLRRFFALATRISPRLAARLALELFLRPPRRRMDAEDAPVVARAARRSLVLGRGRIHALEWTPRQDGGTPVPRPAVLLLHGWGSHAARFGSFVEPMLAAGWRVIALDAPAHGESTGRRSDLGQFRDALAAALDELAPVRGIVAHSLGAAAAVWLLADEPHRDVRSLVVVGMPRDVGYMMESFMLVLDLRDDVRELLRRRFVARFGTAPEGFSAHALAARLRVPTLVVHDEDDDVAPLEHASHFALGLGRGRLSITRGLNHSGPLRDATTIANIVAFVDEHATA
jgi:pimeloyl-ACP methyl ester carboxylesterase